MTTATTENGQSIDTAQDEPTIWRIQWKPEVEHYLFDGNPESPGYEIDEIIDVDHEDTWDYAASTTWLDTCDAGFNPFTDYRTFNLEWIARQRSYHGMTTEVEVDAFDIPSAWPVPGIKMTRVNPATVARRRVQIMAAGMIVSDDESSTEAPSEITTQIVDHGKMQIVDSLNEVTFDVEIEYATLTTKSMLEMMGFISRSLHMRLAENREPTEEEAERMDEILREACYISDLSQAVAMNAHDDYFEEATEAIQVS